MIHVSCPHHLAITKPERSLKIEQDFEVAQSCKCNNIWHDPSKINDYLRAQGWESERPLEVGEIRLNSGGTRP